MSRIRATRPWFPCAVDMARNPKFAQAAELAGTMLTWPVWLEVVGAIWKHDHPGELEWDRDDRGTFAWGHRVAVEDVERALDALCQARVLERGDGDVLRIPPKIWAKWDPNRNPPTEADRKRVERAERKASGAKGPARQRKAPTGVHPTFRKMAESLIRHVIARKPDHVLATVEGPELAAKVNAWGDVFRLMVQEDGRGPDRIDRVLLNLPRLEFWADKIQGPESLRRAFDRLENDIRDGRFVDGGTESKGPAPPPPSFRSHGEARFWHRAGKLTAAQLEEEVRRLTAAGIEPGPHDRSWDEKDPAAAAAERRGATERFLNGDTGAPDETPPAAAAGA